VIKERSITIDLGVHLFNKQLLVHELRDQERGEEMRVRRSVTDQIRLVKELAMSVKK
jgi:hypothetical protein